MLENREGAAVTAFAAALGGAGSSHFRLLRSGGGASAMTGADENHELGLCPRVQQMHPVQGLQMQMQM